MMEYVLMTKDHISQVADLERLCFSAPWSENAISAELVNPLSCWLVAVDRRTVAGYVGSQAVLGEADMMNIAVHPDYRRLGVGRNLVEKLINCLKDRENYQLSLEVRASNEAAIALYQKIGFKEVGRRPGYYVKPKEDAIILRKEWEV